MSRRLRLWIALGLLAFVGNATLRPAIAGAASAAPDDDERGAPAPAAAPTATPYAGTAAPAAPPYAAPPYGQYPPPGYAPAPGYYPGYPPLQLTKVHKVRRG